MMFTITLIIIGVVGLALIVIDMLQFFSMDLLNQKNGQSTKVTVGLSLMTFSVLSLIVKYMF